MPLSSSWRPLNGDLPLGRYRLCRPRCDDVHGALPADFGRASSSLTRTASSATSDLTGIVPRRLALSSRPEPDASPVRAGHMRPSWARVPRPGGNPGRVAAVSGGKVAVLGAGASETVSSSSTSKPSCTCPTRRPHRMIALRGQVATLAASARCPAGSGGAPGGNPGVLQDSGLEGRARGLACNQTV